MTWLADDVRRGFTPTKGRNSFYWNSLFFTSFSSSYLNQARKGKVGGLRECEGGKLCIYFYYPNKRKDFFITQHTWFPDSLFLFSLYALSEPPSRGEEEEVGEHIHIVNPRWVREFYYCYFLATHMMGCLLCMLQNNLLNHVILHSSFQGSKKLRFMYQFIALSGEH